MSLAIFDLDNTLIGGDSDHLWGEYLVEEQYVNGEAFQRANDQFYEDYQRSQLDIQAYLRFALEPLSRFSAAQLRQMHTAFMAKKIQPIMLPKAQALIEQHRQAGDHLLIITATNRFVTQPIAQALGIDDILASEPEMDGDIYTGRSIGTPCYQEGKIERLKTWLSGNKHTLEGSYFYSDSINDVPLLSIVTHPIAVDPDQRLENWAHDHGWQVMSLR